MSGLTTAERGFEKRVLYKPGEDAEHVTREHQVEVEYTHNARPVMAALILRLDVVDGKDIGGAGAPALLQLRDEGVNPWFARSLSSMQVGERAEFYFPATSQPVGSGLLPILPQRGTPQDPPWWLEAHVLRGRWIGAAPPAAAALEARRAQRELDAEESWPGRRPAAWPARLHQSEALKRRADASFHEDDPAAAVQQYGAAMAMLHFDQEELERDGISSQHARQLQRQWDNALWDAASCLQVLGPARGTEPHAHSVQLACTAMYEAADAPAQARIQGARAQLRGMASDAVQATLVALEEALRSHADSAASRLRSKAALRCAKARLEQLRAALAKPGAAGPPEACELQATAWLVHWALQYHRAAARAAGDRVSPAAASLQRALRQAQDDWRRQHLAACEQQRAQVGGFLNKPGQASPAGPAELRLPPLPDLEP